MFRSVRQSEIVVGIVPGVAIVRFKTIEKLRRNRLVFTIRVCLKYHSADIIGYLPELSQVHFENVRNCF